MQSAPTVVMVLGVTPRRRRARTSGAVPLWYASTAPLTSSVTRPRSVVLNRSAHASKGAGTGRKPNHREGVGQRDSGRIGRVPRQPGRPAGRRSGSPAGDMPRWRRPRTPRCIRAVAAQQGRPQPRAAGEPVERSTDPDPVGVRRLTDRHEMHRDGRRLEAQLVDDAPPNARHDRVGEPLVPGLARRERYPANATPGRCSAFMRASTAAVSSHGAPIC